MSESKSQKATRVSELPLQRSALIAIVKSSFQLAAMRKIKSFKGNVSCRISGSKSQKATCASELPLQRSALIAIVKSSFQLAAMHKIKSFIGNVSYRRSVLKFELKH